MTGTRAGSGIASDEVALVGHYLSRLAEYLPNAHVFIRPPSPLYSEFWLGLDKIRRYTRRGTWHLKVEITYDILGHTRYGTPSPRQGQKGVGEWDSFSIGPYNENYKLKIGKMFKKDNMGTYDPMSFHNNAPFSSSDRDNDWSGTNCADQNGGGWWFVGTGCLLCCGNCLRSATKQQNLWIWYTGISHEQVSDMKMWIKEV